MLTETKRLYFTAPFNCFYEVETRWLVLVKEDLAGKYYKVLDQYSGLYEYVGREWN